MVRVIRIWYNSTTANIILIYQVHIYITINSLEVTLDLSYFQLTFHTPNLTREHLQPFCSYNNELSIVVKVLGSKHLPRLFCARIGGPKLMMRACHAWTRKIAHPVSTEVFLQPSTETAIRCDSILLLICSVTQIQIPHYTFYFALGNRDYPICMYIVYSHIVKHICLYLHRKCI